MTRFSPENKNLSPVEWSELAVTKLQGNNDQYALFGCLGMAMCVGASASPITGLLVAGWAFQHFLSRAKGRENNIAAIVEVGCVAHTLEDVDFKRYLRQVGHDALMEELNYAQNHGLRFSNDALDYYEDSTQASASRLLSEGDRVLDNPPNNPLSRLANKLFPPSNNQPKTEAPKTETQVEEFDPQTENRIDIIAQMSERVSNSFILGISGSGKGMLISNVLREIKKKHSDFKIFYVDPKSDPKEYGYVEQVADVIKRYKCETEEPEIVSYWIEKCLDDFNEYAKNNERTLLVIDEGTVLGLKCKIAKSTILVDRLSSLTSLGGSDGKYVYFVAQTPFVGGSGIDLSASSQLVTIAIVSGENKGSLHQWRRSAMFGKCKNLDGYIDNSPVKRAVYYGKTARWYSMPELTNYSGIDRDNFRRINENSDVQPEQDLTTTVKHLESIYQQDNQQDNQQVKLSDNAQIILEILQSSSKGCLSFDSIRKSRKWTETPLTEDVKAAIKELIDESLIEALDGGYYRIN
jgi:Cdc6-like AAA superfamily ATPase